MPTHGNLAATRQCVIDKMLHRGEAPDTGDRPDICLRIHAVGHTYLIGGCHKRSDELVVDTLVYQEATWRSAPLSVDPNFALECHLADFRGIDPFANDDRGMAAELHQHRLHGRTRQLAQVLADCHRPRQGHHAGHWRLDQGRGH
ncbi:hypothetical protein D3C84_648540 [compost metagenome]